MDRLNPERAFDVRVAEDGAPGSFTGYASVFGVVDSHGTVFDKGAFKKTIKDRKGQVSLAWMHDPTTPLGLASLSEDDKGLRVDGQLDLNVQRAAEVYSGMKMGYINQMSHSFRSIKERNVEADDKSQIPHYQEVRLFEISPVTSNFASNAEAVITSVRTEDGTEDEEAQEAPMSVPAAMTEEMERLEALLAKPHKPGNHLRALDEALTRIERALE